MLNANLFRVSLIVKCVSPGPLGTRGALKKKTEATQGSRKVYLRTTNPQNSGWVWFCLAFLGPFEKTPGQLNYRFAWRNLQFLNCLSLFRGSWRIADLLLGAGPFCWSQMLAFKLPIGIKLAKCQKHLYQYCICVCTCSALLTRRFSLIRNIRGKKSGYSAVYRSWIVKVLETFPKLFWSETCVNCD